MVPLFSRPRRAYPRDLPWNWQPTVRSSILEIELVELLGKLRGGANPLLDHHPLHGLHRQREFTERLFHTLRIELAARLHGRLGPRSRRFVPQLGQSAYVDRCRRSSLSGPSRTPPLDDNCSTWRFSGGRQGKTAQFGPLLPHLIDTEY